MKVLLVFLLVLYGISISAQNKVLPGFMPAYQPINTDSTALEGLLKVAADATVIGLGEVTHGTQEVADLQVWMAKRLIQDQRVNAIVLGEVGLVESLKLHRWLYLGDRSVRNEVLLQFPQFNELFLWLEKSPKKVFILGADVSDPKALFSYLSRLFPSHDHVLDQLKILNQYLNKKGEWRPDELSRAFEILQTALKTQTILEDPFLKEALLHAVAHQEYDFQLASNEQIYLRRDAYIFSTVLRIKEHVQDARLFLMGVHNYHVNKVQIMISLFNGAPTAGELLARHLGQQYFAIGTEVGRGEFSYGLKSLQVAEDSLKLGTVLHRAYPEAKWGVLRSSDGGLNDQKWKLTLGTAVSEVLPGLGRIGSAFDALVYFRDSTPYDRSPGYALAYKITKAELAKMDGAFSAAVESDFQGAAVQMSLVYYDEFDGILHSHFFDHLQVPTVSIPPGAAYASLWIEVKGASPLHITAMKVKGIKFDPKRLRLVDSGRNGVKLKIAKKGVSVE